MITSIHNYLDNLRTEAQPEEGSRLEGLFDVAQSWLSDPVGMYDNLVSSIQSAYENEVAPCGDATTAVGCVKKGCCCRKFRYWSDLNGVDQENIDDHKWEDMKPTVGLLNKTSQQVASEEALRIIKIIKQILSTPEVEVL